MNIKRQCVMVRVYNSCALKDKNPPLCTFSMWPLSPALNICNMKDNNNREFYHAFIDKSLINSLLLSTILAYFASCLVDLLFIYLEKCLLS